MYGQLSLDLAETCPNQLLVEHWWVKKALLLLPSQTDCFQVFKCVCGHR